MMTRGVIERRNIDEHSVVKKVTSCETTFEGVQCLSFFRQYKVAIMSNAPSKFDPDALVIKRVGKAYWVSAIDVTRRSMNDRWVNLQRTHALMLCKLIL
jgi:hypothetical protein